MQHPLQHHFLLCYAGLKNPFTLMSYVTPVMAITTAILSIALDPWHDFRASHFFDSSAHILESSLLMLLGGSLAFFMVWSGTPSLELRYLLQSILCYIFACTKDTCKKFFIFYCSQSKIHVGYYLIFSFCHASRILAMSPFPVN